MKHDPRIKHQNMTSFEVWSVLCHLLNEALYPAVAYSNMSIEIAASCLSISTSSKRKISAHTSQELLEWLFNAILATAVDPTVDKKHALVTELLERGVERNILGDYALRVRTVGFTPNDPRIDVNKGIKHADAYMAMYEDFRMDLVYRYLAFTEVAAKRNNAIKSKGGLMSSEGDQINVYTISLLRAIDKFVPYKGTLTSYIQQWFMNAEGASSFMSYTDEAYSMPRNARKAVTDGTINNRNRVIPLGTGDPSVAVSKQMHRDSANDEENAFLAIDPKALQAISRLPKASLLWILYDLPFDPLAQGNSHD